jgi:23S rRNA (uracil1939-C5)-methyltransferase
MTSGLITIRPEKFVQGGLTLGHHEGQPVFVHGALPGELVQAGIRRVRTGHRFAAVSRILEPSPLRKPSDCSIFPQCGGCSYRHIDYTEEIEIKRTLLEEHRHLAPELHRLEFYTAFPDGYRHHARLHCNGSSSGFFALWTEELIQLPETGCLQLAPELNAALRETKPRASEFSLYLSANHRVIESGEKNRDIDFALQTPEGSFSWTYRPGLFFQANRFLIGPWLAWMENLLAGTSYHTLELFCGTGIIGGYLRKHLRSYTGIESSRLSLKQARWNFQHKGLEGRFLLRDLYQKKDMVGLRDLPSDLWIVNPPRAGMKENLCQEAICSKITEMIYSSCSAQTLNRDLGILKKGGFEIARLAAFDFFPRTPHLELVVHLRR